MAAEFRNAGIHSAEDLRQRDPDDAYAQLIKAGSRPHFIAYYALIMGLQGRPWNDCQGQEKQDLRQRFDRIVTRSRPETTRNGLARALDEVGIRLDESDST